MMNEPEQHDRVEWCELRNVPLREMLTKELAPIAIMFLCILDVARLDIEADVIDTRHIVQDISGSAADIEHALSLAKFHELVKADSSPPVCPQQALERDVEDRRTQ